MASWQFSCNLINNNAEFSFNQEERNILWGDFKLQVESIPKIERVLKPQKSWSVDIKQYGELDSHCLEISFDKDRIEEISLRIDLRELNKDVFDEILDFIKSNNALILLQDGRIIEPEQGVLLNEIKKSDAYKYVSEPNNYLERFDLSK